MVRRIVLEMDVEGSENLIENIARMLIDRADLNGEFCLRQEILPEKSSEQPQLELPRFMGGGLYG